MRLIGTSVIYPKEMTDEISTPRLRRPRDELRRRASRDGGARPEGGSARRQSGSQGAHREIARVLQGGRRQGPARQGAAEIPRRLQEREEVVARAKALSAHSRASGNPGQT